MVIEDVSMWMFCLPCDAVLLPISILADALLSYARGLRVYKAHLLLSIPILCAGIPSA